MVGRRIAGRIVSPVSQSAPLPGFRVLGFGFRVWLVESYHLSHNLHPRSRHGAKLGAKSGGRRERELQIWPSARQENSVMDVHTVAE